MELYYLIAIIAAVPASLCQQYAYVGSCNQPWNQRYSRCLADNAPKLARNDYAFQIPDKLKQNSIQNQVNNNCFRRLSANCNALPFPNDNEIRIRRECFFKAKEDVDQQLKDCLGKGTIFNPRITDWQPPADYPELEMRDWQYQITRVDNAMKNPRSYCSGIKNVRLPPRVKPTDPEAETYWKQELDKCVRNLFNFGQRPPRYGYPPSFCDADATCWANVDTNCKNTWNKPAQPAICSCSKKVDMRRVQNTYRQCFDSKISARDRPITNDDPVMDWVNEYRNDYCFNQNNHPCKQQRQARG